MPDHRDVATCRCDDVEAFGLRDYDWTSLLLEPHSVVVETKAIALKTPDCECYRELVLKSHRVGALRGRSYNRFHVNEATVQFSLKGKSARITQRSAVQIRPPRGTNATAETQWRSPLYRGVSSAEAVLTLPKSLTGETLQMRRLSAQHMPARVLRAYDLASSELPKDTHSLDWRLSFTSEAEWSRRQTQPPDGPDLCPRCGRSGNAAQRKSGSIPPPAPPLRS